MHGQNQSLEESGTNCCSVSPLQRKQCALWVVAGFPVVTEERICETGARFCPLPGTFPNTKKKKKRAQKTIFSIIQNASMLL